MSYLKRLAPALALLLVFFHTPAKADPVQLTGGFFRFTTPHTGLASVAGNNFSLFFSNDELVPTGEPRQGFGVDPFRGFGEVTFNGIRTITVVGNIRYLGDVLTGEVKGYNFPDDPFTNIPPLFSVTFAGYGYSVEGNDEFNNRFKQFVVTGATPAPEPASLVLSLTGVAGLGGLLRRRHWHGG